MMSLMRGCVFLAMMVSPLVSAMNASQRIVSNSDGNLRRRLEDFETEDDELDEEEEFADTGSGDIDWDEEMGEDGDDGGGDNPYEEDEFVETDDQPSDDGDIDWDIGEGDDGDGNDDGSDEDDDLS